MKRPLFVIGTTLLFAVAVSFLLDMNISFLLSLAVLLTGICLFLIKKSQQNTVAIVMLTISLGLALGGGYLYLKIEPFQTYTGEIVVVQGFITEAKQSSSSSLRYTINAEFPEESLPKSSLVIRDYVHLGLVEGEKIRCTVRLQQGKYDTTRAYYLRRGIPLEGVLLEDEVEILDLNRVEKAWGRVFRLRDSIYKKNISLFSSSSAKIINGMVFGMTDDLDAETYTHLNRSGISHLVSVSGLHLSILTGVAVMLLSYTPIPKRLQWLLAIVANIFFVFLVGFSPPVIRSLVMSVVFLTAKIVSRQGDSTTSLGLSAIIILFVAPYWALSMGMWLSYFATMGILVVGVDISDKLYKKYKRDGKYRNRLIKGITASLGISIGAYLFTLPILVVANGWLSLVSPLANILVSPFSSVVVVGGVLAVILPVGFPFYPILVWVVDFSAKVIERISQILAYLPFAAISLDSIFLTIAILMVLAVGIITFINRERPRGVAAGLLIAVILLSFGELGAFLSESNRIQLVSLGENQQVLIRRQNAVVIGVPDKYSVEDLIKYLDYKEVTTIDCLMAMDVDFPLPSSLLRLREHYNIRSIIGEDDVFLLEELSETLPGIPVYAGGYARAEFLGGAVADLLVDEGEIRINIGSQKVRIMAEKYDIMEDVEKGSVEIYSDGVVLLPSGVTRAIEPLGRMIYNETRIPIKV